MRCELRTNLKHHVRRASDSIAQLAWSDANTAYAFRLGAKRRSCTRDLALPAELDRTNTHVEPDFLRGEGRCRVTLRRTTAAGAAGGR